MLLSVPVVLGADEITVQQLDKGVPIPALAGEDASLEWTTVLACFDLFSLWTIVLLVIGYSITAKVSRWRAAVVVVAVWVVFVAGMVGLVALDRVLGG